MQDSHSVKMRVSLNSSYSSDNNEINLTELKLNATNNIELAN